MAEQSGAMDAETTLHLTRQNSVSVDSVTPSETLSDYVRNLYRESSAVFDAASSRKDDVQRALQRPMSALRGVVDLVSRGSGGAASRAEMRPLFELDFDGAVSMDEDRIRLLLSTSLIRPSDQSAYVTLLVAAQALLARKAKTVRSRNRSLEVTPAGDAYATDGDIMGLVDEHVVSTVVKLCKFSHEDEETVTLVRRALTHESALTGQVTNRALALVGDAALRLMVVERLVARQIPLARVSAVTSNNLSNRYMTDVMRKTAAVGWATVGKGVARDVVQVQAPVLEAIYGVAYLVGGVSAVADLNDHTQFQLVDFTEYDPPDETMGDRLDITGKFMRGELAADEMVRMLEQLSVAKARK